MTTLADYVAALERAAETAEGQAEAMAIIPDYRDGLLAQARTLRALAKALSGGKLGRDEDQQAPLVLVISLPDTEQAGKETA